MEKPYLKSDLLYWRLFPNDTEKRATAKYFHREMCAVSLYRERVRDRVRIIAIEARVDEERLEFYYPLRKELYRNWYKVLGK